LSFSVIISPVFPSNKTADFAVTDTAEPETVFALTGIEKKTADSRNKNIHKHPFHFCIVTSIPARSDEIVSISPELTKRHSSVVSVCTARCEYA